MSKASLNGMKAAEHAAFQERCKDGNLRQFRQQSIPSAKRYRRPQKGSWS